MTDRIRIDLPVIVLVVANLVPLIGVFFYNWDATTIILLYWCENLIIGFYNMLKMALVRPAPIPGLFDHSGVPGNAILGFGKVFMIAFFLLHYGGFCAGHGLFILEFLEIDKHSAIGMFDGDWAGPLIFIGLLVNVVRRLALNFPPEMLWPLLAIFFSHGVSFIMKYVLGGEYRLTSLSKLMHAPYTRIIIMHVVVLVGGFVIMQFKLPAMMVLLLIALKIGTDITMHLRSHRKLETEPASSA